MTVLKTKDYNLFKIFACNRPIVKSNVMSLQKSLSNKSLLDSAPILVDEHMYIIDGQHRLEACKSLGIPVSYTIVDEATPEDIIRLNANQSVWKLWEYVNFHARQGNEEYILLEKFVTDNKLILRSLLETFAKNDKKVYYRSFKQGKFVFPRGEDAIKLNDYVVKINFLIELIKEQLSNRAKSHYVNKYVFQKALYIFLKVKDLDFDHFVSRIETKIDMIRNYSSTEDFLRCFKNIYNYNSKTKKINLDVEDLLF